MHESRRFCARQRIVETSPLAIQEIVRNNLQRAGALSDDGVDDASVMPPCHPKVSKIPSRARDRLPQVTTNKFIGPVLPLNFTYFEL